MKKYNVYMKDRAPLTVKAHEIYKVIDGVVILRVNGEAVATFSIAELVGIIESESEVES